MHFIALGLHNRRQLNFETLIRISVILLCLPACINVWWSQPDSASVGKTDTVVYPSGEYFYYSLNDRQKETRTWIIGGANALGYGGTMVGLYATWYKDYPQTGFHTFNDWSEWKQVDKVGHLYSAYIESYGSTEMWRWAGMEKKKRTWIGGMSGAFYQTAIEVLDGFSAGWGWSWGDFGANILGSGAFVSQEMFWNEQRIRLKFSFHETSYSDPTLRIRRDELFGNSALQNLLKDYNGQTYWASANLSLLFPQSRLPKWLALGFGYGAEGMLGGTQNYAEDKSGNVIFNRPDIRRFRQWYVSPDIDLSGIKTRSRFLRIVLGALNAFKFPAPALEFSRNGIKGHLLYF